MENIEKEKEPSIVDVLKFEIICVKGNRFMSNDEKESKIKELKAQAPNCKTCDN